MFAHILLQSIKLRSSGEDGEGREGVAAALERRRRSQLAAPRLFATAALAWVGAAGVTAPKTLTPPLTTPL